MKIGAIATNLAVFLLAQSLATATPIPTYGTYFGGSGDTNAAVAVALDPSGNVIMAGYTTSQTLPGTANAFQPTKATGFPDNKDVFIAKFDPTGRTLIWATFLGGNGDDIPVALAVDPAGNIYVTGTTHSSNYPAQTAISCVPAAGFSSFDSSPPFNQNCSVATASSDSSIVSFVSEISADGTSLLYSMTISNFQSTALTVNNQGEAYVATVGPGLSGGVFLFRLNAAGMGLIYGTYLGGADFSAAKITSLLSDAAGNCYVAGEAVTNIPTTANAFQASYSNTGLMPNYANGFVLEVNAVGAELIYGTWFGPQYSATSITAIALNPDGSIYFSGITTATTIKATAGAYQSTPASGYIAKLTPGRATLDSFSYLPGVPYPSTFQYNAPVGLTHIAAAGQVVYVSFGPELIDGFDLASSSGLIELTPTLAYIGSFTTSTPSVTGFSVSAGAIWLTGFCTDCGGSLNGTISSDAFQSAPASIYSAVLFQLTNISPSVSIAASSATGTSPFAAGQLVSIYGNSLGPPAGSTLQLGPGGVVTTSNAGTQVLFDGTAAPIIYTSAGQVNAVIPCALAGYTSTQMVVDFMVPEPTGSSEHVLSAPLTVPLSPAAPGIFTADGSGKGQAAALNQDNSFNTPSNPAARGSILTFYATGVGATSPCVDGQIYQSDFPTIALPVVVGVGGSEAHVDYAGQAPDLVSGVAQFNIVIPIDATTGVVPLTLKVGGIFSKEGVTVAVK